MAMNPDAAPLRALPAWRQRLSAFWGWWTAQLALLVPQRFSSLGGGARVPQLAFEGDELVLVEPRNAVEGAAARVSTAQDPVRARAALRALLERAGEGRNRARIALARNEALLRRVSMPAATEENLSQVLAFEMDRLTPFRADEVYFDHRVLSRDAAAATVGVQLGAARREVVDAYVERLRALGATVEGVNVREDTTGGTPLNLMPHAQRGAAETARERLVKRALWGVVAALFLAVLVYPIWRKRQEIIALHPQESRAKLDAEATDKLARELERLVAEYNFLIAKKHAVPPALAYIEEVSRLLPDNTWVQQLDLKAAGKTRELTIQGETASSSKLIEILEQSKLVQNATPRGTIVKGSLPGTERFVIAAEAKARPLPETVSLAQLPASATAGAPVPAAPNAPATPATAGMPAATTPGAAPGAAPPVPAKVEVVKPSGAVPPAPPPVDPKVPRPKERK